MSRKRRVLSEEEADLWRRAMRHTAPLPGRPLPPAPKKPSPSGSPAQKTAAKPSKEANGTARPIPAKPAREPVTTRPVQPAFHLDAATARKVRRGRVEVDGRIDLHGLRQDEAHAALHRFLASSLARGRRCVLIITGKGERRRDGTEDNGPFMGHRGEGSGVLRRAVPQWLRQDPFRSRIFAVERAHQRDGGDGAIYVFLRRRP